MKVELHPTVWQTFTIGVMAHLRQICGTRAWISETRTSIIYASGMADGENLRECKSAKSPPSTGGDDKILLIEFTSAREKSVLFFILRRFLRQQSRVLQALISHSL